MKQIVRAFLFLLLFAAASNTTMADEKANIVKQGTVRGRIIDVTKQTLPGASIYIEKLHTGVTSDVNGFYTFPNLDPGTYTVKVSYVWGIERSGFFNGREKWAKGFENQRV